MILNSREGQQTQIICKDSGLTLTEIAQRCGRCLTPAIIQGQFRQGCEQPDLLEHGPAHCGAPDVLKTPLPTQTSLQFCLLSIRKAPRLQITRKSLPCAAAVCPAPTCSSSQAEQHCSLPTAPAPGCAEEVLQQSPQPGPTAAGPGEKPTQHCTSALHNHSCSQQPQVLSPQALGEVSSWAEMLLRGNFSRPTIKPKP